MKKITTLISCALIISSAFAQGISNKTRNPNKDKSIEMIKIIDGDTVMHDIRVMSGDHFEERQEMHLRMKEHQMEMRSEMLDELSEEIEEILQELDVYVKMDDRKKEMIVRKMIGTDEEISEIIKGLEQDDDLLLDMSDGNKKIKVIKIQIDEESGNEMKTIEMRKNEMDERRMEIREERRIGIERPDPLRVFPNPVKEELNLGFEVMKGKPAELSIMDMDGEKIFNKTYKEEGTFDEIVDLKGKKKGIYVIRLTDINRTISKTIIVE